MHRPRLPVNSRAREQNRSWMEVSPPLHFPVATPPRPGETVPIAPGVVWLRMPLPFALDHINLWLLEDGAGWTIVDTGYAMPEAEAAVGADLCRAARRTAGNADHRHPLSSRPYRARRLALRALAGAVVDHRKGMAVRPGAEPAAATILPHLRRDFARRAGLDTAASEMFGEHEKGYRRGVPSVPPAFRPHRRRHDDRDRRAASGGSSSARAMLPSSPVFIAPRPAC